MIDPRKTFLYLAALGAFPYAVSASTITAPPLPLARRQGGIGSPSCSGYYSFQGSCYSATTDFFSLDFGQQASCLCYSSSTYAPSVYDGYVSSCVAYLVTASPSFYSALGGTYFATAPCAELAAETTGGSAALTTSPPQSVSYDANYAACVSVDVIEQSCSQSIQSFSYLPFSVEASCFCYESSTYAPNIFDGYWGSCLDYFKTASPAFYSSTLDGDNVTRTPCAYVGNIRSVAPMTSTTSSVSAASSTAASVTGTSASSNAPQSSTLPQSSPALTTTEPTSTSGSSSGTGALRHQEYEAVGALVVMAAIYFVL